MRKSVKAKMIESLSKRGIRDYKGLPFEKCTRKELMEVLNELPPLKDFKRKKITGFVYFIGNLKHAFVKIGYSKNPSERIKELQTGCPFKLDLLFSKKGDFELEKSFHNGFKEYHTYGEWFKIEGDLAEYIIKEL